MNKEQGISNFSTSEFLVPCSIFDIRYSKMTMRKYLLSVPFIFAVSFLFAQKAENSINAKEVERIEKVLSSDDMRGRKTFTPDIDKAADFIAGEFKKAGLQTWNGKSYRQEFAMVRPKLITLSATFDGAEFDVKNVVVVTCQPELHIDNSSGYDIASIKPGQSLNSAASSFIKGNKNVIVLVDKSFASNFSRLTGLKRSMFKTDKNFVFILADSLPSKFTIDAKHEISEQQLANVVGILPGKSKKDEYVIFSGHYDHLGVTTNPVNGDSIYNGANDDAAGTTALIMLAKFFKALGNNERTIVFAAFTAEEIGGYGSQYFSRQFDAEKVAAMFNIEMIGTESKWGKNAAYITGYEKTNMGEILQKNLEGSGFNFYPDPYPEQNLFYRSDNATLARLGVPAHTISTAKMDGEPNYHKLSDEISTLDMENMAMIIRSIAVSSKTIVAGKDTPTKVKVDGLK
jgi:Zn-dependent M28 family amino/carboxypeptidase